MKHLVPVALLASLAVLVSCTQAPIPAPFQLTAGPDGRLFRLNTGTGETYLVTDTGLSRLTDGDKSVTLHVGEYYEMADAPNSERFLKYVGQGHFERSAWGKASVVK